MNKYSYWDTVMEYLPNYHNRSDVLLSDILARYIDDEEVDDGDLKMIETNYGSEKHSYVQFSTDDENIESMRSIFFELTKTIGGKYEGTEYHSQENHPRNTSVI